MRNLHKINTITKYDNWRNAVLWFITIYLSRPNDNKIAIIKKDKDIIMKADGGWEQGYSFKSSDGSIERLWKHMGKPTFDSSRVEHEELT